MNKELDDLLQKLVVAAALGDKDTIEILKASIQDMLTNEERLAFDDGYYTGRNE